MAWILWVALLDAAVAPVLAQDAPPSILLAREAVADIDPAPYWVSEKLDGVRALWDGRQLRFRSGRTVSAPHWFLAALPKQALDGELWLGRGRFAELSGIVRTDPPDEVAWRQVRYMIFELPEAPGDFTTRIARLARIVSEAKVPWLAVVRQRRVADRAVLATWLAEVVDGGGEGLMLHRADAPYLTGRSDALLKLKPWQDDEGIVVAHLPGQGRFAGMLGALELRLRNGRRLRLGTGFTDEERRHPPAIGVQVTYRYRGLTATGLPRFASFLRVREPL
jgi:DNA ligase-1